MGYELYKKTIDVESSKKAELTYELVMKSKSKILKKSLIFPGRGQWYAEYKTKGTLITLLQIATIAGAVGATVNSMNAQSEYDDAQTAYKTAYSSLDIKRTRMDMKDKYDTIKTASTLQMAVIGAVAGVYLWNIIDAAFTSPKTLAKQDTDTINIKPAIKNGYAGVHASLRF